MAQSTQDCMQLCLYAHNPVCTLVPSQVWDAFGSLLFASAPFERALCSAAWAPGGDTFAVGGFDCVVLCDQAGWAHSKVRQAKGQPCFALPVSQPACTAQPLSARPVMATKPVCAYINH